MFNCKNDGNKTITPQTSRPLNLQESVRVHWANAAKNEQLHQPPKSSGDKVHDYKFCENLRAFPAKMNATITYSLHYSEHIFAATYLTPLMQTF